MHSRTCLIFVVAAAFTPVRGEPYIAVQQGLTCGSCHVNRTGGGLRTPFGAGVGRQWLPWHKLDEKSGLWDGTLGERVRLGADLRAAYVGNLREDEPFIGEYELSDANLYLAVDLLPERLTLYVDESVSGGASSREVFGLARGTKAGLYGKAGRFLLPFGLRLQDDEAFIRRATGFNFDESDVGIEVGAEPGPLSLALAITNGTSGGAEQDNGKMVAWRGSYTRKRWRAGLSAANNDLPGPTRRSLAGAFAGFKAGSFVGLFEWDLIRDDVEGASRIYQEVSHLEVDWTVQRGITLRAWYGAFDPERDVPGDRQEQAGLGADVTVWPGVQVRTLYRRRDGPASVAGARDDQAVLEVHLYF